MVAESIEEITLALEIIFPALAVDTDKLLDIRVGYLEPFARQARRLRHVTNRCFIRLATALGALDNPAQHAQIFTESRPKKSAALVALEEIHAENFWRVGYLLAHR